MTSSKPTNRLADTPEAEVTAEATSDFSSNLAVRQLLDHIARELAKEYTDAFRSLRSQSK